MRCHKTCACRTSLSDQPALGTLCNGRFTQSNSESECEAVSAKVSYDLKKQNKQYNSFEH